MHQNHNVLRRVAYPAIDGIRFYAALAVFIEHVIGMAAVDYFGIPGNRLSYQSPSHALRALFFLMDGNHGVDVFFLISGFLMARVVLSDERHFSYLKFIGSRVKRIYPAFFVSLIVATAGDCLLFGWTFNAFEFAKNLVFLNAVRDLPIVAYNNVTWSLGFEFAFYLAIPVLILIARLMDKRIAALLLLAVAAWFLPDPYTRMKGLFVGALIGAANDKELKRIADSIPLWIPVVLYMACAIGKALWITPYTYDRYYYAFLPISSLLFIKIVWDEKNTLNRFLSGKLLRGLGTLSYSIYLYHSIIASVVLYFFTPHPASLVGFAWYVAATCALTIAAAYASYMLIEKRYFSRQRKRIPLQEPLFSVQDRPS
jgi:peptidoglycan/LPS O-acetylase OafA/YrhL